MIYRVSLSNSRIVPIAPRSPLDFPSVNNHVLLAGSSGSGKSFLASKLFPHPDGMLLFKPDPIFSLVPLASQAGLPSPFLFQPGEIADAYYYSRGIGSVGLMASSFVPLVFSAFSGGKTWVDVFANLHNTSGDRILKSVSDSIIFDLKQFYPDSASYDLFPASLPVAVKKPVPRGRPPGDVLVRDNILSSRRLFRSRRLSFSGLSSRNAEFGAELFLRGLYSHLDSNFGVMLIDEFHHVARPGSIMDTLLREFRVSGSLCAITQSLSDISDSMLNNFGYLLISRTLNRSDLLFLKEIDPNLPSLIAGLPPHVFFSLSEYLASPSGVLPFYSWVH